MKWNHTTIHLKMFRMSYKTTIQRHLNTFRLIKILPMGFMPTMSNSVLWQFNSQSAWNEQTKTKSCHFRDFYFSIVCNQIWFLWLLNGATYKKIDLKSPFSFSFDVFLFFVVVEKKNQQFAVRRHNEIAHCQTPTQLLFSLCNSSMDNLFSYGCYW